MGEPADYTCEAVPASELAVPDAAAKVLGLIETQAHWLNRVAEDALIYGYGYGGPSLTCLHTPGQLGYDVLVGPQGGPVLAAAQMVETAPYVYQMYTFSVFEVEHDRG